MSPVPEPVSLLDRQCVERLKPVRFGVYSSTVRVVDGITGTLKAGLPLSTNQRLALYAICWRYRAQLADPVFTARVLIVERLLVEYCDVQELAADKVLVRAWRKIAPSPAATRSTGTLL